MLLLRSSVVAIVTARVYRADSFCRRGDRLRLVIFLSSYCVAFHRKCDFDAGQKTFATQKCCETDCETRCDVENIANFKTKTNNQ